ncbi:MAG: RNA polymerase sigma factor [Chloroflexi bacterium]|nr:RNA polymerase sigma factor [Chloroflexota bacterium]MBU1751296.1 RNA polymerase sigma factor [Chloroflexota bacterium]MBU1878581.1 RNA polymerase sigma factor [Chloroflexota bacterium]
MHEDNELIAQIRQGNTAAFELLYNRYKGPVYRTALAITKNPQIAEEILQDCFLRVYRYIDRVNGDYPLSPWLHRITVNLCYNRLERKRHFAVPLEDVVSFLRLDAQQSPESRLESKERRELVREHIAKLSPKYRAVLVLYYLQGFSQKEVADILDCPVGTVKSRLHYACRKLRDSLEQDVRLGEPAARGEVAYELA